MHNNDNLSLGCPDKSTHLVSISLTSVQCAHILATMKNEPRHVILVVQDNPDMADEIGYRVEALGFDIRHARTASEARAELDRSGFCLVILDLSLRLHPQSRVCDTEVGFTLLRHFRQQFPDRNAHGKYSLQIISMLSAETPYANIRKAYQLDANDVLFTTFSENPISIEDAMRQCFRQASRVHHAQCVRGVSAPAAKIATPGEDLIEIKVTGKPLRRRYEVLAGEKSAPLPSKQLMVLLRLYWAALTQPGGWLFRHEVDPDDNRSWSQVSRLREVLDMIFGPPTIETLAGEGCYRLAPRVRIIEVNFDALAAIREAKIQRVLADLRVASANQPHS